MPTLKEWHEKRMAASQRVEDLKKEWGDKDPSPDQRRKFDAAYSEWKTALDQEQLLARMREMETDELDGAKDDELRRKNEPHTRKGVLSRQEKRLHARRAFRGWLRSRCTGNAPGKLARESAKRCGFDLNANVLKITPQQLRAASMPSAQRADMNKLGAGVGIETIPQDFLRRLIGSQKQFSPVRELATVIRTSGTGDMPMPVEDDVANAAVIEAEEAALAFDAVATDAVTLASFKYRSAIRMSRELAEDSAFDLEGWAAMKLGIRLGRGQNVHFTTGDNSAKPAGYVWRAAQNANGIAGTTGTTLSYALMLDLVHKLDPAYRRDPSVRLSMHDTTLKLLRALTITDQGLVFQENGRVGEPPSILGYQFFINQHMDDVTTWAIGEEAVAFGAMSYFHIRDAGELYLRVLRERYADTDQIAIVLRQRSDSDTATQNDWTTPPIVVLQKTA